MTDEPKQPELNLGDDSDKPPIPAPAPVLPVASQPSDADTATAPDTAHAVPPPVQHPTDVTQIHGPLKDMIDSNFLQYASYVVRDRAIPDVADGLKPVQRRLLFSLHEKDDGRFIKVATITGYCMQYHPHGDAAIEDALVGLVNKNCLVEGQGNFGNVFTGDPAAAGRYIECRLTELARSQMFNDELTEFVPSYDGRSKEPVLLPAKIPLLLMTGAEGIAVGLATRILPHNFKELLEAQIAILHGKSFTLYPDFQQGGLMEVKGYDNGRGHVRVRAVIETRKENQVVIKELPFGMTTDALMASVEEAARKKRINVRSINDYTAEKVEIAVTLAPGASAEKTIQALYAFTGCEVQVPSRIVVIKDRRPVEMTVEEILRANTEQMLVILKKELELERKRLIEELHARTLVQIFVEHKLYKKIEDSESLEAAHQRVFDALQPFRKQLQRDVTKDDVSMLLDLRIKRIARFDMKDNQEKLAKALEDLKLTEANLKEPVPYAIRYLRKLLLKYGRQFQRRTRIATFDAVDAVAVRELTSSELSMRYNRKTGYLGHAIEGDDWFACSSLDKILLVWNDGTYKLTTPADKMFVDHNLIYAGRHLRGRVITLVYTEDDVTFVKRFALADSALNKESKALKPGCKVRLVADGETPKLYVRYVPSDKLRIRQQIFSAEEAPVQTIRGRGLQMTVKTVQSISAVKPADWDDSVTGPRGKLMEG
jgi:topoisomerase-4 subunit A